MAVAEKIRELSTKTELKVRSIKVMWSLDTTNNTNWKLINVHKTVDSGTNLHSLPAVVKLFGHKCHPNT